MGRKKVMRPVDPVNAMHFSERIPYEMKKLNERIEVLEIALRDILMMTGNVEVERICEEALKTTEE